MKRETTQYSFRLPVELRNALTEEARKNERTLTQQIIFELKQHHPEATGAT